MIVKTYFVLVCVYFSVQLLFTVSGSILQQQFVKTNIRPTSSCVEVANRTPSFVHCSASCLKNHKDNVVFSRHAVSTRCVCCRPLLTGPHYFDTEWITYKQGGANIVYCPTGYIGVNSLTVRTCLRLELMTKQYDEAATSCQSDGGDLIRIDSAEKYTIFQQFITNNVPLAVAEVWIQSFRDSNEIWRFHDGTVMLEHCPLETINYPGQIRIRFTIAQNRCYDHEPTFFYNSVCEI